MTAISPQPLYPWQQVIYSSITQPFSQGRGHHALLFKTEAGLGSEVLIRHFAHWLLCQNKNSNEPCHQCKS
ncbi:MAG: DNA polymerase III subunit delta', partial [Haemophilus parahaemolyticus]|nr:DNA polymerase III subunit delta' [Haemophilus parahaemolyticus]